MYILAASHSFMVQIQVRSCLSIVIHITIYTVLISFQGQVRASKSLFLMHLSMLSPRGGGGGLCGAFDFSEEFLVKIPTVGTQNLVKSDQISPH